MPTFKDQPGFWRKIMFTKYLLAIPWLLCTLGAQDGKLEYPAARQGNQIDDYHGVKIRDPYRWLEDTNSPETAAWVNAENKLTFRYLDAIPARERIRAR